MSGGPVGKCGLQRRRSKSLTYDRCFLLGIFLARDFSADFGVLFFAARQCNSKAVPHRELSRLYRFRRDRLILGINYELSNLFGYVHKHLSWKCVTELM